MKKDFVESNIVILGNFNPSNFDKLFFIKNNLISEKDFLDSSIFTPEFVFVDTNELIINVHKHQMVIVNKSKLDSDIIRKIAEVIIDIEGIIFNAIGFNFKWFLFIDDINTHTRQRFYSPSNHVLNKYFDCDNTAFGYYVSKDFLNSRMKLDVKPINLKQINTDKSQNILSFDFNFHVDNSIDHTMVKESLKNYDTYFDKVKEIVEQYE